MMKERNSEFKKKSKVSKVISVVISTFLIALFIFVLISLVYVVIQTTRGNQANLFGYRLYYVLTDSMTPTIEKGEMIISKEITDKNDYKKVDEQINVGDIVTYKMLLDGKVVQNTHRVIEDVHFDLSLGTYVITTKGDKAGSIADSPIPINNLESIMIKKSTIISSLYNFLRTTAGIATLIILPLALVFISLIYQLIVKIKGYKEPIKKEEEIKVLTKEEREEKIRKLTEEAITEYLQNQNKDNQNNNNNNPNLENK